MQIKNIHLIRASQAKPFVETASRLGAPVKALALESALPLDVVLSGEGVIGEHSLWDFVALSSTYLECEHFGYLTALDHPVDRIGKLGGMTIARAKSLEVILQSFTSDVVNQSDNSDYRIVRKNGETWFIRGIPWQHKAGWIAEQYVLTFVIQIIRLCAPGDWLPQRVRIATRKTPVSLPFEWCSITIDWGSR
jgi:hypothetical protein